ncbi:MAG: glycosyltransferase [Prevotella sp.]|nr:glycosyltransferase [Prevotella sp.]
MKKTILHVSKYYYPYLGGIETLARSLAEGMTNYNNVVVCFATDGEDHVDEVNGVIVYRVKVHFSLMSQDIAFGYYGKLKYLMSEYKPEYVHVHCPNPFVYPLVARIIRPETKLVLHWHSDILSKGIFYQFVKPFESYVLRKASRIIATSPNYIHPSSPIYAYRKKISVVQNGMVPSDFDMKENDEQRIANIKAKYDNKPLVLFIGRHIHYKGIDWLLDIAQMVRSDCKFIIAGQGPLTEKLKGKNTSPKVEFTGKLPADELRCYAHAADIFAFTSNTKAEAFGIALAEAMYCGCVPVVFHLEGSGVNWVSIKDETGLEVPLGNLQAYADAIDRLLSDSELRTRLATAARQRASSLFTESKAVELMENIYNEL